MSTDFPEPPDTEEFRRLSQSVRDWRPDYRVGDRVRRTWLGGPERGIVRAFSWRGNHLMTTVEFARRTETFVASEYTASP